jgi:D-glycero-D-manno-heptose 1,7-bisphosphate phosphatase
LSRKRAVFLDRDGVINRAVIREGKPYPPAGPGETIIVEGAAGSLTILKELDFLLLVVTNQPDVARKTVSRDTVESIHRLLASQLPLDEFFSCFHDDQDACDCRKPKPGMLIEAAKKYDLDLGASYLIGDRWRDIEAGFAAGCCTILIDYHYQEKSPPNKPDVSVTSLADAVDWIRTRETQNK